MTVYYRTRLIECPKLIFIFLLQYFKEGHFETMQENLKQENKMGVMPIGRLLASMAWPAIISMTINALYNIVDSMFVAKISEDALAAVTYVFPINMLIVAFGVGTGVGVNSLIARRLGAKNFEEANYAAEHGLRLALINWALFAVFGAFFAKLFMSSYSDIPHIVDDGTAYMRITTIGSIFVMISMMTEKTLQARGNMILPMVSSLIGALTNIVLDPILIFGYFGMPKLGVTGAAAATVIGQFLSMCFCIIVLFKIDNFYKIRIKGFKFSAKIIKDIYEVGMPGIVMQAIGSVMLLGFNAILGEHTTAVAVLGVYFRLQSFIFMPVFGLNQGSMPIMGYNYGAGNRERLMRTFKVAFTAALVYMLFGFLLFQIFPKNLLDIFEASSQMKMIGISALRMISFCFIPASFGIMATAIFQATAHGVFSLLSSFIRQLASLLPIAWVLMRTLGVQYVWLAFPLAEIIGFIFSLIALKYVYSRDIKNLQSITIAAV